MMIGTENILLEMYIARHIAQKWYLQFNQFLHSNFSLQKPNSLNLIKKIKKFRS